MEEIIFPVIERAEHFSKQHRKLTAIMNFHRDLYFTFLYYRCLDVLLSSHWKFLCKNTFSYLRDANFSKTQDDLDFTMRKFYKSMREMDFLMRVAEMNGLTMERLQVYCSPAASRSMLLKYRR